MSNLFSSYEYCRKRVIIWSATARSFETALHLSYGPKFHEKHMLLKTDPSNVSLSSKCCLVHRTPDMSFTTSQRIDDVIRQMND